MCAVIAGRARRGGCGIYGDAVAVHHRRPVSRVIPGLQVDHDGFAIAGVKKCLVDRGVVGGGGRHQSIDAIIGEIGAVAVAGHPHGVGEAIPRGADAVVVGLKLAVVRHRSASGGGFIDVIHPKITASGQRIKLVVGDPHQRRTPTNRDRCACQGSPTVLGDVITIKIVGETTFKGINIVAAVMHYRAASPNGIGCGSHRGPTVATDAVTQKNR